MTDVSVLSIADRLPLDDRGVPRGRDVGAWCAELVRRYLTAFGPAKVADLSQFTILKRSALREVVESMADVVAPEAELASLPPRLLGMWDSVLLAYADRSRVIPGARGVLPSQPLVGSPTRRSHDHDRVLNTDRVRGAMHPRFRRRRTYHERRNPTSPDWRPPGNGPYEAPHFHRQNDPSAMSRHGRNSRF
jgi:hypothetical protein